MQSGINNPQSDIKKIISDIDANKSFAGSLPFQLNRLKMKLNEDKFNSLNNAIEMINSDLFLVLDVILLSQVKSSQENIIIKISEIYNDIVFLLLSGKEKDEIKKNFLILKNHNFLPLIMNFLNHLSSNKPGSVKAFVKVIQVILPFYIEEDNKFSVELLNFLLGLLDKVKESEPQLTIIETIKSLSENENFFYGLKESNYQIENFITKLLKEITFCSDKSSVIGIQILDSIMKKNSLMNFIIPEEENEKKKGINKPISFFLKLISKAQSNSSLTFYSCKIISQFIEKKDLEELINFLGTNSIEEVDGEGEITKEIKGLLDENKEAYSSLKKSVTRILLLVSKNNKILELLKNSSTIACFIELLKSDIIEIDKKKTDNKSDSNSSLIETSVDDLIKLLINIVKKFNFGNDLESINLLSDICFSFSKVLKIFPHEFNHINEILNLIIDKNKKSEIKFEFFFSFFKSSKETEETFVKILMNYFNKKIIYSFLHKVPIHDVYKDFKISPFVENMNEITAIIDSLREIYNESKKEELNYLMIAISFKLILGNTIQKEQNKDFTLMFPEKSFTQFCTLTKKLISLVIDTPPNLSEIHTENCISYLLTMIFSSLENPLFGEKFVEEKCELVFNFVTGCNKSQTFTVNLFSYLSMRLNRLIEYNLNDYIKIIFVHESLCDFVLNSLQMYNRAKKEETFIKEILTILYQLISSTKDGVQLNKFLKENGIILLINIITNNIILDYEIIKLLIKNLRVLSTKNFSDTLLIFQNSSSSQLRKLFNSLRDIKFSKGINEKVYYEFFIFVRNLLKSIDFFGLAEETNIITFFINEYIDIIDFYNDTKQNSLEVICEIISIMCQSVKILSVLMKTKMPEKNLMMLKKMDEDKSSFNTNLLEDIITISTTIFRIINAKDNEILKELYSNKMTQQTFQTIKKLISEYFQKLNDTIKIFSFLEPMVTYESIQKIEKRIITIEYLTSLQEKLPTNNSQNTNLKIMHEKMENCIKIFKNPEEAQTQSAKIIKSTENDKMMKDLIALTNERKNAVRRKTNEKFPLDEEKSVEFPRGRTMSISNNQTLKVYYDKILTKFNTLVKEIPVKALSKANVTQEYNELGENLLLWKYFIKDDENIQKMFEDEVVENFIIIIDSDQVFSLNLQEQAFSLFEKIASRDVSTDFICKNKNIKAFLFREISKMNQYYNREQKNDFLNAKISNVTKTLAKLTANKSFLDENKNKFSKDNIIKILYNENCGPNIVAHLLTILRNFYEFEPEESMNKTEEEISNENQELCDLLLKTLWERFENEISVIKVIISIIESKYKNESFISMLVENKLVELLCKVFIIGSVEEEKRNSEGFLTVLNVMNKLSIYPSVLDILTEIGILPIFSSIKESIFNTKIVEQSLQLFVTCLTIDCNKYIEKVCITDMKELTIQILDKYLSTCHTNIVLQTLKLIYLFLNNTKNIDFYSNNINTLLKSFKLFLKNPEIISLTFDITNKIVSYDVNVAVQRTKRINSVIGGNPQQSDDTRGSLTSKIASSSIAISSGESTGRENTNGSFDLLGLFGMIADVFRNYLNNYEILEKLYELLINLSTMVTEFWVHKAIFDVLLNNANAIIDNITQTSEEGLKNIEIFANTLLTLMINDYDLVKKGENVLVIFLLNKIVMKFKLNKKVIDKIMSIIYNICLNGEKNSTSRCLQELYNIFAWFRSTEYQSGSTLSCFCLILKKLTKDHPESAPKFAEDNFLFILSKLDNCSKSYLNAYSILADVSDMASYYEVTSQEKASEILKLITSLLLKFQNEKNNEAMRVLLKIIIGVFNHGELLKLEITKNCINITGDIRKYIEKNNVQDQLLEYSLKSYEMSIKFKSVNQDYSKSKEKETKDSQENKLMHLNSQEEKAKSFLTEPHQITFYKENGETEKCTLYMNETLEKIISKTKNKIVDEMLVSQMDSCVRNCSTGAFTKKKWNIFSKKPKPKLCFSIIGVKELNKQQKMFSVECTNEETCIKYVDYISTLIESKKKEEGSK